MIYRSYLPNNTANYLCKNHLSPISESMKGNYLCKEKRESFKENDIIHVIDVEPNKYIKLKL